MSLAEQLRGAAWAPDGPRLLRLLRLLVGTPDYSFRKLEGAAVAGRIRREAGLRSWLTTRLHIVLAEWEGQARLVRGGGMVLVDRAFGHPVASCDRVSPREVSTITVDGRRFVFEPQLAPADAEDKEPAAIKGGHRVVDEAGREMVSIVTASMPPSGRWPLQVSDHLDDALAIHLVALTSAMAIKIRHMQGGTRGGR